MLTHAAAAIVLSLPLPAGATNPICRSAGARVFPVKRAGAVPLETSVFPR